MRKYWPLLLMFALLVWLASRCQAITYAEWIATFPALTGNQTAANADPDGDGIVNLMEFALDGMDPATGQDASHPSLPRIYIVTRNASGTYVAPSLLARASGGAWTGNITVSDAVPEVCGSYRPYGTSNNRTAYSLTGTATFPRIAWSGTAWEILTAAGVVTYSSPSSVEEPYMATAWTPDTTEQPAPVLSPERSGLGGVSAHLTIRYRKRPNVTGLRYVPQTNVQTLSHWGYGDSAITEWTDNDGWTWARTLSDVSAWGGRGFMRLRVEVP